MNYFRYLSTIGAFILFVIAIKFFNDGNMAWWLFMFAFIIVSGFLIGEENIEDEQVEAMLKPRWYDNAHCMECGYVNKACVCKPVVNVPLPTDIHDNLAKSLNKYASDWEEYKATYVEDDVNDGIIVDNIVNIDAEIKYKTDESDYNPRKEEMEDDIPF